MKTKNELKKWIKEAGYSSSYSGRTKTLYVHGVDQKLLDYWALTTNGITLKAN